jgi:hypothetical protein
MTAFNIDRFTTSGAPDLAFGTRGEITTTSRRHPRRQSDDGAGGAGNILGGGASRATPQVTRRT